jgi:hypothetical protein
VITVYFDHLPERMADFISGAHTIRGCVAWLTHPLVLKTLADVPDVQLVVQMEDFLRPEPGSITATELRKAYDLLTIRWKGPLPDRERTEWPKMHHKFLVRMDTHVPSATWTGSFNPTVGSGYDDNAIMIHDEVIAMQFYHEWERIWRTSEEIVWK